MKPQNLIENNREEENASKLETGFKKKKKSEKYRHAHKKENYRQKYEKKVNREIEKQQEKERDRGWKGKRKYVLE